MNLNPIVLVFSSILLAWLPCAPGYADLVWHLNGDGNAIDQSGNGHDGTLNGTTYGAGRLGQGFLFNGANDFITVNGSGDLEPADFSVAMWINTNDNSSGIKLLMDSSHGSSNGPFGWAVQMNNGRAGLAYGNGSSFPGLGATTDIRSTGYRHFAATIGASTMSVYSDGQLETTAAYAGVPMGTGLDIRLGKHFSLNRQYNGLLDEIHVYNHALSNGEVQQLAAVPEPSSALATFLVFGMLVLRRRK